MPQLDTNAFISIALWLIVTFNLCFAILYVISFLPFINQTKIYARYASYIYLKVAIVLKCIRARS